MRRREVEPLPEVRDLPFARLDRIEELDLAYANHRPVPPRYEATHLLRRRHPLGEADVVAVPSRGEREPPDSEDAERDRTADEPAAGQEQEDRAGECGGRADGVRCRDAARLPIARRSRNHDAADAKA